MKNIASVLLLLAAIFHGALFAADGAAKTKVLLITGGHKFEVEPFLRVFQDNLAIEFTASEHRKEGAAAYERDDLLTYDVVVLYDMPMKITGAQKTRFLSLFDKGIGLVVLHHALVSYPDWPDYERIIGGRYPKPATGQPQVRDEVGYKHDEEVPVVIAAKDHPITAGLKEFTIHDEIYWGFRVQPDVTPLISTTHPQSGKPLAWARTQGNSRISSISATRPRPRGLREPQLPRTRRAQHPLGRQAVNRAGHAR